MEENATNTEQHTQAENMGNETDVQGAPKSDKNKEPKLFTQEEVNSFVQSRVSRLRGQIEKESRATYEQKAAELEARERKLMVKEELNTRGMAKELADVITCTDEEDLKNKLNIIQKIYGNNAAQDNKETAQGFVSIGVGYRGVEPSDPVRDAMGLKDRR